MLNNIDLKRNSKTTMTVIIGILVIIVTVTNCLIATAFLLEGQYLTTKPLSQNVRNGLFEVAGDKEAEKEVLQTTEESPEITILKKELLELADRTNRGFTASGADKKKADDIVRSLQSLKTIPDPARTYYERSAASSVSSDTDDSNISISGKWTLIYTDAPDITGLDTSRNPFSTAKLGRIGQECSPPYIKNVIEWVRPDWAENLPFSGSTESRILQKVVTSGSATPAKPTVVNLKVAGLELVAGGNLEGSSNRNVDSVLETVQKYGLPAGVLSITPVDLKGPLNPPFGRFEILYLDNEFRAIRTSTNYLAVNRRINNKDDEWF